MTVKFIRLSIPQKMQLQEDLVYYKNGKKDG